MRDSASTVPGRRIAIAAVRPGDDAAIAAVLARDHPVYAAHPRTTLAGLAAMITRDPA